MDQQAAQPGSGAVTAEQGPHPRATVRITIGALLTAYYLHVLVAVVRGLPANLHVCMKMDYAAPWLPRLPHWLPSAATAGVLTGISWLAMLGLLVGGVAMIVNHRRGMQIGLIALGVSLVQDLLLGLPTSLALAMGWMRISFTYPPQLAQASAHLANLPPSAMRMGGEAVLVMTLLGMTTKAGVFVWLRRYLARTRPTSPT